MSHGWAVIPSWTRVPVRRIPRPGVPLRVSRMAPGYARLHPIPAPGTSRVRHPKGRTTARAGSHWDTKEPRPALGQPGPRSESGTRPGPTETRCLSQPGGPGQERWRPIATYGPGRKPLRGPNTQPHVPRRARPAGIGLRHPGSQHEDGCMQPGRSQGNQLPGRWTGA